VIRIQEVGKEGLVQEEKERKMKRNPQVDRMKRKWKERDGGGQQEQEIEGSE
jgi:hypothetical protein